MRLILMVFLSLLILNTLGQKLVLIEQFTNASCGSCALYTPDVVQFADEHSEHILIIVYHGPYPGLDSMYYESSADVDARFLFYDIFSVPSSVVDGNYFIGSSFNLLQTINDTLASILQQTAAFQIDFNLTSIQENIIEGSVEISKDIHADTSNLVLQIAFVEKLVLESDYVSSPGSNGESKFNYVVRDVLFPVGNALNFSNHQASYAFSGNLTNFKNSNQLRIVAFIQDTASKEIKQSGYIDPFSSTIVNEEMTTSVQIFPNPAHAYIQFTIDQHISSTNLKIFDVQGKLIDESNFQQSHGVYRYSIQHLKAGFYILQLNDKRQKFLKY